MTVINQDLINFLGAIYQQEEEIIAARKDLTAQLKSWAENHEIEAKAMTSAYNLYKKYKGGKNSARECEDLSELSGIIEAHFATSED